MNYNVRIDDNFLRGDHVDGEVLQHTDLNELENVAKTAINANYEDIQKLQDGTISVSNSEKLNGATLSKFATETLQNSDTKVPTSSQVKNYVDGAIGNIDLNGYYTKRETDEILVDYPTFTDYAGPTKSGVIKTDVNYGTNIDPETGKLIAEWDGYQNYQTRDNHAFISKGTLENVISGKELIDSTELAEVLPTKTSDLTNDSGFITKSVNDLVNYYTKNGIDTLLSAKQNIIYKEYKNLSQANALNFNTADAGLYYTKNCYITVGEDTFLVSAEMLWNLGNFVNNVKLIRNISDDIFCYITRNGSTYTSGEWWNYPTSEELDLKLESYVKYVDLTDYVKNTDYATDSKGGVVRTNAGWGSGQSSGMIYALTKSYADYTSGSQYMFIGKGTLENVITGKGLINNQVNNLTNYYTKTEIDNTIGDIGTILDNINNEVL